VQPVIKTLGLILALFLTLSPTALRATDPPPACKPVKHYNVAGCEPLADQSCPAGYHKQAVDPPNSMMKGPTYLMCVADKPPAKDQPAKTPPKPNL
jgi:hypothetical protein